MFDFGEAIRRLKAGSRVARSGWNGKGMWLVLLQPRRGELFENGAECHELLPCIGMKTATGEMCPGWLASQTDMLATDWVEVAAA